jgi:uncharacterized membrane protein
MKLILSSVILLCLDSVFIYFMSDKFRAQVLDVQGSALRVNVTGAVLCYAFLIFALNYFIIRKNKPVQEAFLLGLVVYGVYETTTIALLKNWRWSTAVIDTLWGGVLFALTTYLTSLWG